MWRRWSTCAAMAALIAGAVGAAASATAAGAPPGVSDRYETHVLVRGADIHGANGLAIDPSGRLLVASVFGGELVALDPQTGRILERLGHDLGGPGVGVDGPDDVAVGPDGSIYWTDILLGEVGRLAPDGTVTKQFVAMGMNPIAFTADGRLFVAQAFFGDGLFELDPDLADPPRVVIANSGASPFIAQLNGFDFGPDGQLYSPQPFLGRIVRIDPESGAMTLLTQFPAGVNPSSVEFDSRGRLHASLADTVVRVDRITGAYSKVRTIRGAVLDNMVFDARDRLFVSNSDDGSVYAVAPGGGVRTLSRGGLILPGGIALMRGGSGHESLFVADLWSLAELDANSGRLLEVDRQSRAGGGIVESWTVAPDGGNVILTSWMSNAVQIWNPVANEEVSVFTDFAVPLNAIRFQGDLVVAELGTGSVSKKTGAGAKSPIATGLFVPTGLAATEDDLWVADWATGMVWKIVSDGAVLSEKQLVASGLVFPEGMAVDTDGSLLVLEAGAGRLTRIDPATGQKTTLVTGLELGAALSAGAPPAVPLSSVAVGRNGTLFVTGDAANLVYRLRALPPK